jgi:hypothetical protein
VAMELPEFAITLRGYDRMQVDQYLVQLGQRVLEAERRAKAAEAAVLERDRTIAELQAELPRARQVESPTSSADGPGAVAR